MDNVILEKSFLFAKRIVKMNRFLQKTEKEYVLTKQLLRCGTSIGANIADAQQAQSKADFTSKVNIALKETVETKYWLRLLYETEYLTTTQFNSISPQCQELEHLLISIVKTSKH